MRFDARPSLCAALAVILCAGGAWPAIAADGMIGDGWVAGANSRARLHWCGKVTGPIDPAVAPLAFLELTLEPGWKTYWRSPGDSGVPPTLDWSATSTIASTTVYYPAPRRLADADGFSIGYKTAVTLPIRIEPKPGQSTGQTTVKSTGPLTVTASYGICKNICVPVEVTLTSVCGADGYPPAFAAAVEAVPRAPGQGRATDPKLVAVSGSVVGGSPRLTVEVDFGAGAAEADLFIEAPEGLYVPLPSPATPDAKGRARYVIDLSKVIDAKDLLGKALRLTMVSSKGAAEAVWVAK